MSENTDAAVTKGVHHLALAVVGNESLDALYDRLESAPDIYIEFPPEPLLGGPTRPECLRGRSGLGQ